MSHSDSLAQRQKKLAGLSAMEEVMALLDLERIEVNLFRGISPQESWQRVYGGQVIGQALVAAGRTIDDKSRLAHSLHAYFLRPGDRQMLHYTPFCNID